jgi:hypothetical protein
MESACAVLYLSSSACPVTQYFSALSNKRHDFRKKKTKERKKVIEHEMCVLISSNFVKFVNIEFIEDLGSGF